MNALLDIPRRWERDVTRWLARNPCDILRITLAVVFLWFGALKLFPGASPAEDLAGRTINALSFGFISPAVALKGLAVWECGIGLGLLSGRKSRIVIALLLLQMAGTLTPLILFPSETWVRAPFEPTLLGQYILKNQVLVGAALALWGAWRRDQNNATMSLSID